MSDELRAELSALAARVAMQQQEIDELRAKAGARSRPRVRRTVTPRRLVLGIAITLALAATPVLASHQFTDVPTSSTYHADISAIAAVGVTTGCAAGKYCPKDFVTREQMAAFLNRLGALQAGKTPVVNATKLDGIDSTDFLRSGDIVVHQLGPWESDSAALTFLRSTTETRVETAVPSDGAVLTMNVNLPASIAGRTYGLKSVKVCWSAATPPGLVTTSFLQETRDNATGVDLVEEVMDRSSQVATCYTLADPAPTATAGSTSVRLVFYWNGAGVVMRLRSSTITWTPVS